MSNATTTPEQVTERAPGLRRGGHLGRLIVGDYVGQPAGEAAQAVRCAGLRPGLDRSFGCEPDVIGLVVAQEPPAGSDMARDGMVTLYVGAPALAPAGKDAGRDQAEESDPAPNSATQVEPELCAPTASLGARRPRKPGLADRTPLDFGTPPAPLAPEKGLSADARDGEEFVERVLDERGDHDELSHEEFVVHVDDLFAGRADRVLLAWRRVYPRKRMAWPRRGDLRARALFAEHPRVVKAAGAGLALWVAVAVAASLAGHPAPTHSAGVLADTQRRSGARAIGAHDGPNAVRAKTTHPARGSTPQLSRHDHRAAPRRSPRRTPAKVAATRPEGTSVRTAVPHQPASPTPVSQPAAQVPEQTPGGPFSP